jgi:IclR family transcriptional regulator, acetate operon repressor
MLTIDSPVARWAESPVELPFHIVSQLSHPGTQAIDRAGALLVCVVESPRPLALGELAELAGLPRSTTSRLVSSLERQGLVQRAGGLRPGPVLLRLAQRGVPEVTLVELADDALRALADESGETINLAVPTPLGVDQLVQVDSRHFIGSTNWVGRRLPYHCTANGKVFLAFGAAPMTDELERVTERTITTPEKLGRELTAIRAQGYATAIDELELGLSAVAAPVHGADREVVAALSVSGPTIRLTRRRIARLVPALLEQARRLSTRLGRHDAERGAA